MTVGSVAILGSRGYPSFYGGFETLVRKLTPFLADRGWTVTVYGRDGSTVDSPEFHHPRVTSLTTKGIESKSLSTLTYGATSILDAARKRPDVALVMNVANGFWLPALRARRIPSVVNVDGIEWERAKWGPLGKRVFKSGARMTAKYGDVLVADSTEIGRYWKTNFDRESVFIPYGGDVPSQELAAVDGLEKGGYVLLVARFVPENTVVEFIEAAESISAKHQVVIVGSSGHGGPLEDQVRELSENNDRITWTGHISDDQRLYALWQNAGAYFHGHSVGGTNPALVQAMACAAPTVARDTVFNREVLSDSAIFVEPEATEIASALDSLMTDPALQQKLGSGAETRARDSYSWESICSTYEETLLKAMSIRRPRRK